jgi:methionyl-tRNA synthetase
MSNEPQDPSAITPSAPVQAASEPVPAPPVEDPRVGIEDFLKLDIRAARIVGAERVPKSKKLMKLEVDLGTERRQLVAGIAEAYEAEALVGRLVAVIVNLKPATLMGIQSNGMVLAASTPGGLPILVAFEKEPPLGSRVK